MVKSIASPPPIVTSPVVELPIVTFVKLLEIADKVASSILYPLPPVPIFNAVFEVMGASVKVPPDAVRAFQDTPPSERKDGLFDPAAKLTFEAEIEPVPAFKLIPLEAKVTTDPPEELLKNERFSLPDESESEEILPDKLTASISVVSLAAPIVINPVADKLPPDANGKLVTACIGSLKNDRSS